MFTVQSSEWWLKFIMKTTKHKKSFESYLNKQELPKELFVLRWFATKEYFSM